MQYPYYSFEVKFSKNTEREKTVWRPIVEIILLHKEKIVSYPVLIDSGADYNIFDSGVAEALEIKYTQGKKRQIYGLGAQPIKGYECSLDIRMFGLKTVHTKAIFTKELSSHAFGVLGNDGFFNHFRVEFNYTKKIIDVKQK